MPIADQQLNPKYRLPPEVVVTAVVEQLTKVGGILHGNLSKESTTGLIVTDSRRLVRNCVFIAIKGQKSDGHEFISAADRAGTSLIVCEIFTPNISTPQLVVPSSREAWAWICSMAWGHPSKQIKMLAVTGTNGKTSTVWMAKSILTALGVKTASIGTLGLFVGENSYPTKHTTPDPDELYGMIRFAVDSSCEVLLMEVASHAIAQKKITPIEYSAGVWTSFSQDHLDLHGTMNAYFETKYALFSKMLLAGAPSIIHADVAKQMPLYRLSLPEKLITYTSSKDDTTGLLASLFHVTLDCESAAQRGFSEVSMHTPKASLHFRIPFIGGIFAENFAAAILLCRHVQGEAAISRASQEISSNLRPVPGRMEPAKTPKLGRPLILIDYAHTPDALEKSLAIARSVTRGKLAVVFGCGGDRDRSKRPLMGAIAERLSDLVIVTNDNPRHENPNTIIAEILAGMSEPAKALLESDRSTAIAQAISHFSIADTVVIAGKGHENYQTSGDSNIYFSDRETAQMHAHSTKKWCVIGAGVSGISAAKKLRDQKDLVCISDSGLVPAETKHALQNLGMEIFSGGHEESHLANCDGVVLSPGIVRSNLLYSLALKKGLSCVTEIDLGFEHHEGLTVAITGTNGKSTTCALAEHALKRFGIVAAACGNIGKPPTSLGEEFNAPSAVLVCELSSYQLEQSLPLGCDVAVVTSFSFDHIARHGSMAEYFRCKWSVTTGLKKNGLLLLRGDVFVTAHEQGVVFPEAKILVVFDSKPAADQAQPLLSKYSRAEHWWLDGSNIHKSSESFLKLKDFELQGLHNQINAAFVAAILRHLLNIPSEDAIPLFKGFKGLPYRCQIIGKTAAGHPIINDSKSTNVESTLVALSATEEPVVLLVGGASKGESFKSIAKQMHRIRRVIAFGAARNDVARDLAGFLDVSCFETMEAAVKEALSLSTSLGCGVLLSPACASFDEFRNYEHRGAEFNDIVNSQGGKFL